MIYVDMNGRCGNQFFQYAFARKLSIQNGNQPIYIDFANVERWRKKTGMNSFSNQLKDFCTVEFSETVGTGDTLIEFGTKKQIYLRQLYSKPRAVAERLNLPIIADYWQRIMQKNGVYRDDEYKISPRKCKSKDIFLRGYFENPKYYADMHEILTREFTPIHPPKEKNKMLYNIINNRESVCVSFRVWNDLKDDQKAMKAREVCTPEYYRRAVEKMRELLPDVCFIVFSNEIQWVREHFDFPGDTYFEDGTDEIWEKMRMMYSCKHFIMSTSTFCWWAQYLSRNENKIVIAPDRWTNDNRRTSRLIMQDWKKIKI